MRRAALPLVPLSLLRTTPLLPLAGCHSAMIQATVHNGGPAALQLIEVDYPSASFGAQGLVPGGDFKYRFKVLGSGKLKVLYTDGAGQEHSSEGPELQEGLEGQLAITISGSGVQWTPHLTASR